MNQQNTINNNFYFNTNSNNTSSNNTIERDISPNNASSRRIENAKKIDFGINHNNNQVNGKKFTSSISEIKEISNSQFYEERFNKQNSGTQKPNNTISHENNDLIANHEENQQESNSGNNQNTDNGMNNNANNN